MANTKNLGVLRGGQIVGIVGSVLSFILGLLLILGTIGAVDGETITLITIVTIITFGFAGLGFIFSLVGWNKFGLSITAGIFYVIGSIPIMITLVGIVAGILILIGGILMLCGAKQLK